MKGCIIDRLHNPDRSTMTPYQEGMLSLRSWPDAGGLVPFTAEQVCLLIGEVRLMHEIHKAQSGQGERRPKGRKNFC